MFFILHITSLRMILVLTDRRPHPPVRARSPVTQQWCVRGHVPCSYGHEFATVC